MKKYGIERILIPDCEDNVTTYHYNLPGAVTLEEFFKYSMKQKFHHPADVVFIYDVDSKYWSNEPIAKLYYDDHGKLDLSYSFIENKERTMVIKVNEYLRRTNHSETYIWVTDEDNIKG